MQRAQRTVRNPSRRRSAARRRAMALLARARRDELAEPIAKRWPDHGARDLKPVESGLVMLRGRIGGDGAPFNLGEATVTRAVVELPTGERGFAHILGRDAEKARLAAIADALWQRETRAATSKRRSSRRSLNASPPKRPRCAPRPRRRGSTSSRSCAARTRHERARLRRSDLPVADRVPLASCGR